MRAGAGWPTGLVLGLYLGAVLLPVLLPFQTLLSGGSPTGAGWKLSQHGLSMAHSLGLATAVTVATLGLGLPLALLLYRTTLPLRSLWLGALLAPLLVPPYILGVGVLYLLTPRVAVGFVGTAVTMTIWLLPLVLLFAGAGLRLVTRAHEESALLETTPLGVLRHVTLPTALPHALAGALFVFALAIGEFGVPSLFQYRVYPGVIFAQFAAFYDFRQAVLTALPLLVLVVLLASVAQRLYRLRERTSGAERPLPFDLGGVTLPLSLLAALLAFAAVLPLLRVAQNVGSVGAVFHALTAMGSTALRTFVLALLGAGAAVLLALLVAWVICRLAPKGFELLHFVQLPLFAVPPVVVGLGLIQFWNTPDWRGVVYTSPFILALGYLARFTPLLVPLLVASYEQLPRELDEAARLDGASPFVLLRCIHLPLLRPVLGASGLLAFVLGVGEVPVSMLVAPPGSAPLAVRFFTLITNAPAEQVAALSLITTLLALLPVVAWLVLERR
jgi:iron(III) transport system permease protein